MALNAFKCTLATMVFLCIVPMLETSFEASFEDVCYLVLSAFLGIFIGDGFWLYALQVLGPRKVIVCDCVKPFLAAAVGYVFLDDEFEYTSVLGIILTMIGVLLISLENSPKKKNKNDLQEKEEEEEKLEAKIKSSVRDEESFLSRERIGVICAVLNVIFDVLGSFLTRSFGEKMNTFEINTVRFGSASVMLWIAYLIVVSSSSLSSYDIYRFSSSEGDKMNRKEWSLIALGVLFVTVGCPALSNYALFKIELGICLTLTSIGPLYALPLTYISKGESISMRSILAALLSCGGVAVLYTL